MSLEVDIAEVKELIDSQLIDEGMAQARQQFAGKINDEELDRLSTLDPTSNKKYVIWLGSRFLEDKSIINSPNVPNVLKKFEELSQKNVIKNKDINSYKTLDQVATEVEKSAGVITTSQQKKGVKDVGDINPADITFKNDLVTVVEPKTKEASILYGRGTRWCTAAMSKDNMFDKYTSPTSRLFYILPTDGNNKFALRVQKQYITLYDAKDEVVEGTENVKKLLRDKFGIDFKTAFGLDEYQALGKFDGWSMKRADGSTVEVDIYEPRNVKQAQEYGKGTKWSISKTTDSNRFLFLYSSEGRTFYIIVPRDGSEKILADVPYKGDTTYWDQNDNQVKIQLIHAAEH
jgi:hypothetical protein